MVKDRTRRKVERLIKRDSAGEHFADRRFLAARHRRPIRNRPARNDVLGVAKPLAKIGVFNPKLLAVVFQDFGGCARNGKISTKPRDLGIAIIHGDL